VDPATRNLAVRDIQTGDTRTLTDRAGAEYAYFSAISRDSKQIAYAWFNSEGFYELRVTGISGGNHRVLFRNEEAGFLQPCGWTPGDTHVLTLLFRKDNISQIALVPIDGGPPQILRSLMWVYPKRMDLSPDGNWIVYDSFAKEGAGDRTIFLLATDGKTESKLIDMPGDYLFPLWTPDGKTVFFVADHGGTTDLWSIDIAGRKPRLVRRDLGRALPMGITKDGAYIYGLRTGETDVFVSTLTAIKDGARRASARYPGRNMNPVWSRNGAKLAYLSRRGSENFGLEARAIVIRTIDSDEERELLPHLAHIERIHWSPDAAALLVSGSDGKGRAGLYIVDATTASVKPLVREAGVPFRGYEGVWSSDGKSVVYVRDSTEVRSRLLATNEESVLHEGSGLQHLVTSPDGKCFAVASGGQSILVHCGGDSRSIPFPGVTELDWSHDLIAAKGPELWRVPMKPDTAPVQLDSPGNRRPGFSVHPDGNRIALTVSDARSEVWSMPLPPAQ
jgi:Tol biopolymer transport system component